MALTETAQKEIRTTKSHHKNPEGVSRMDTTIDATEVS